jgi:hypothetical protein
MHESEDSIGWTVPSLLRFNTRKLSRVAGSWRELLSLMDVINYTNILSISTGLNAIYIINIVIQLVMVQ